MRIWLDPAKLNNYGLTTGDVVAAIQRAERAGVGRPDRRPAGRARARRSTASIIGPTRLSTPEEFRNILLRVNPDGSQVRSATSRASRSTPRATSATPSTTASPARGRRDPARRPARTRSRPSRAIHETLDRLAPFFPRGFEVVYPLDTTPFVRTSIEEVVSRRWSRRSVLVFLVMFLFLQNLRATLIPTIAVPVVLLGTFGVLAAFGFSINTLTMFGMALSIGLLVDDAIVVVENVERVMVEEGLSPRKRRASRWTRSPARWSPSRWCSPRCSCRWRSSAARSA